MKDLNIKKIVAIVFFIGSILFAQPSGGPYGPIQKSYELPESAGKIYYVAPDGQAEKSGETLSNPTTIEKAIELVKTGDVIVLRGGIYRTGNIVFNQGITIQPYAEEKPVFKGTYVASKWKNLGNGLWSTQWSRLFPSKPADWWQRNREGKKTPQYLFNNDMVFVNGNFLQAKGWEGEVTENSYYIDYDAGLVYIGVDPTNRTVEITAFDDALLRTIKDCYGKAPDHKGPIIRGVTFTGYAYRAIEIEGKEPEGLSSESDYGKDVIGTTLENCTISFCSRVAGYFRGDNLTIRNCRVSETSTEGIYVIASSDVLLEKNIFSRNNIEKITGYYPAAVKIFNQCYRATCRDNLIVDLPFSNGIWYDVGNVDGRFINNWVEGVGDVNGEFSTEKPWPSNNGFFFEISKGAICAGNVFVNCDHGLWVLNSSDVKIYQNTFVNSTVCIARNARSAAGDHFGWHPSTGPDIDKRDGHLFVNNLLTGAKDFKRLLLYVWQPDSLGSQLNTAQLKQADYNMYVRASGPANDPLILWNSVKSDNSQRLFYSLEEFKKLHPEFSIHSRDFQNYNGPLFKCSYLNNYQLLKDFPGAEAGSQLPPEVNNLIHQSKKFIGAYPPIETAR